MATPDQTPTTIPNLKAVYGIAEGDPELSSRIIAATDPEGLTSAIEGAHNDYGNALREQASATHGLHSAEAHLADLHATVAQVTQKTGHELALQEFEEADRIIAQGQDVPGSLIDDIVSHDKGEGLLPLPDIVPHTLEGAQILVDASREELADRQAAAAARKADSELAQTIQEKRDKLGRSVRIRRAIMSALLAGGILAVPGTILTMLANNDIAHDKETHNSQSLEQDDFAKKVGTGVAVGLGSVGLILGATRGATSKKTARKVQLAAQVKAQKQLGL